jgi:ankyrin repeat protein
MPPSKKKRGEAATTSAGQQWRRQSAHVDDQHYQLVTAAMKGDGAAVARLLAAGANPSASIPEKLRAGEEVQTTPLVAAALHGRLEVARLLLESGADPSVATSDLGFTPLMAAAENGQPDMLQLLLARGAAVDAVDPVVGFTAFHLACRSNQPDCAEALVRAGCDFGIKITNGQTGRDIAEEEGHDAVVERLRAVVVEQLRAAQAADAAPELELATVVTVVDDRSQQLIKAADKGDEVVMSRVLAAGANPNALAPMQRQSGEVFQTTALCQAAAGHLEAARLLLNAGADPSLAAGDGFTPLLQAAGNCQLEMLQLLLARGATVDAVDPIGGCTAFHFACYLNQPDCVEALVRAGCDVGFKSTKGVTGRAMAETQGGKEVVRRLRYLARQPFVGVLVELAGLVGVAEYNGKRAAVRATAWRSRGQDACYVPHDHTSFMHSAHRNITPSLKGGSRMTVEKDSVELTAPRC